MNHFLEFFLDPVFRGPFFASILMAVCSSLIGTIALLRKTALIGETLSHSAYPGVILGIITTATLGFISDGYMTIGVLIGGFAFCILGHLFLEFLVKKCSLDQDGAQCFVLATLLGLGITISSLVQTSHAMWYRKMQVYLYGQAATMGDFHIYLYGFFALFITAFVIAYYHVIRAYCFDPNFSFSIGVNTKVLKGLLTLLVALAVVIGLRSVGGILMCGMLIAPGICARQLTKNFSKMLIVSVVVAVISSVFGVYLSILLPEVTSLVTFPTGPAIVLVASFFCLVSFIFAPRKGIASRVFRRSHYKRKCVLENLLKAFWKGGDGFSISYKKLYEFHLASKASTYFAIKNLIRQGWIKKNSQGLLVLTGDGFKKAAYIVRLHRLFEAYLVSHLGFALDQIHNLAEEMEHSMTPDVEKELTQLLLNPKVDPHDSPIPCKEWI